MAAALDVGNVEKKFRGVTQTQESIQSLTLWVIHHKAHHEKIVDLWFQVLKKAKMPHRLTLFYLCNDIVQTCKKKHAIIYKDAFKEVLKDAVLLVRDVSVRKNVDRIFTIWEERKVYDAAFLEELSAILNNTKVQATEDSKLLAEFKPRELKQLIIKVKKLDDEVAVHSRQLASLRLDTSNVEAIKQLKDRSQGKEFCHQFEDGCHRLETFITELQKAIKDRATLVEMLEQSELFYDTQYGEAKIVANAYKNFGTRVNNLRRRLDEHIKELPEPYSPVPSPTMDAPSPGNTPPLLDSMDMDMSDDDERQKQIPGLGSPSHSVIGLRDNRLNPLGPRSWSTASETPSNQSGINVISTHTPSNDDGSSTPVQDEQPEMSQSTNPIEFLTQLITQSQKNPTGPNSSFFQSLSELTEKVKSGNTLDVLKAALGKNTAEPPLDEYLADPTPPAPPAWEPWTSTNDTPAYVPNTAPTPSMPFSESYGMDNQPSTHDMPHMYTSATSYAVDSLPAFEASIKPPDPNFPAPPPIPGMLFGIDPSNPPPPPIQEGSTPYNPEMSYDSIVPPMPPPFYQDPTPVTGSQNTSPIEGPPPPFPPPPPWQADLFSPNFSGAPPMFIPPPPVDTNNSMQQDGHQMFSRSHDNTHENSRQTFRSTGSINSPGSHGRQPHFLPPNASQNDFSHHRSPQHQDNPAPSNLRRNLAQIPLAGYDSPVSASNSDTDVDVSTIPTMVGKGRPTRPLHPPRPPTQPPTPQTPITPGSAVSRLRISSGDEDDQQDFIDKLKRKSFTAPSTPTAPPKGILKNTSANRNLRNLTEIPSQEPHDSNQRQMDNVKSTMANLEPNNEYSDQAQGAGDMDLDEPDECVPEVINKRHDSDPLPLHHDRPPPHIPRLPWQQDGPRPRPPFGDHGSPFRPRLDNPPQPFMRRDPRFPQQRPQFDPFRDNHGRPFAKRPTTPFDYRPRRFPHY